jgi:DNA-binding NarL/FixJ family response regulator
MPNNFEELEKIKVLVVDDHMLFAEGTVSLLAVNPRILVIGIAKNGIECIDIISKNVLDIVLLDINLPDVCGTDIIDKIKKSQPEIKILMLTGLNPKGFVTKSISRGASGFLLKECSAKEMIEAILRVNNGVTYFSKEIEAFLQPVKNSNNL